MAEAARELLISDEEARRRVAQVYALLLAIAEQDPSDIVDQPTDQHPELTDDGTAQQEGEA